MKKIKYLSVVLAFCGMTFFPVSSRAMFTVDLGNIGLGVTKVMQGVTTIKGYYDSIANGSALNSIIGDAAGTLNKMKETIGGAIDKAKQAYEEGQKRISAGLEAYNKYSEEIENRKQQYQELMDSINLVKNNGESYNDSEEEFEAEAEDYVADYDAGPDIDYDEEAVSTIRTADQEVLKQKLEIKEPIQFEKTDSLDTSAEEIVEQPSPEFEPPVFEEAPILKDRPLKLNKELPLRKGELSKFDKDEQLLDVEPEPVEELPVAAEELQSDEDELPLKGRLLKDKGLPKKEISLPDKAKLKVNKKLLTKEPLSKNKDIIEKGLKVNDNLEEVIPVIPEETLGRKKFDAAPIKNATASAELKAEKTADVAVKTINKVKKEVAPLQQEALPDVGLTNDKATIPAADRKFRTSPKAKIDRLSSSTISRHHTMMFADEVGIGGDTKGATHDKNGVFISGLAKLCGVSIDDLMDSEKVSSCIVKVVKDNHANNAYDAEGSRKDCEEVVFETLIAISAESIKAKYEASQYGDTIKKMEEQTAESTDERGDMAMVAAYNAESQKILNRISQLIAAQVVLDTTSQICHASKDVLDKTDTNDGDK